jgi:hypothetical protein
MPAVAEAPAPVRRREYLVKFPLFVGNPCLFYPDGVRNGSGRPCIMQSRNNHEIIDLVEVCSGINRGHSGVRHIDDPFLNKNPQHRKSFGEPSTQGGTWDYCEGHSYAFLLPGQIPRFAQDVVARVFELHWEGKGDSEIASTLTIKGLTTEVVGRLIAMQT